LPFRETLDAAEANRFWFQERLHAPEPLYPFDAFVYSSAVAALGQASTRLFAMPSSVEARILNGYVYVSTSSIGDEPALASRAQLSAKRSAFYYDHWDELYSRWVTKVEAATRELQALEVPELPEVEDEAVVTGGTGVGSGHRLLVAYDRLLEGVDRIFQYHFEFLNLGYGAYLAFYELCRSAFPDISDQTVATMVSGIDVLVLRPDDELKRLAHRAIELGVGEHVREAASDDELRAALTRSESGAQWLADWDDTQDPWFYFSCGNGAFYHHHRSWIDNPTIPLAMTAFYIDRIEAGEDIARPYSEIRAERERITSEYRALLSDHRRSAFDASLALARTVFPFVENHNFYIDHRYMTLFWNKARDFGALLAANGVLAQAEDVFYLRHDELRSALEELRLWWGAGGSGPPRAHQHWQKLVAHRNSIYEAMQQWSAPPALGRPPETITEPITVMLWGITTERMNHWLSSAASSEDGTPSLVGVAASGGVVEGRARVVLHVDALGEIEDGEILIAPTTSTSWTPVFGKIAAAVLDVGGIMCHAAIVAREYGLPAIVGTGTSTKHIRTGDLVRVDADAGVVSVLARA
jgi:pyruvate,water dikinase